MRTVLVGVDGSESSLRAARFARSIAEGLGARLSVVHAVEPLPEPTVGGLGLPYGELRDRQLTQGQRVLDDVFADLGLDEAEQILEAGRAAETICAAADERMADLIVVGAHGYGPHRMVPGSVSARLVTIANRTLTIVR
jgi:nucleotide-binding universal stress UspA family protein